MVNIKKSIEYGLVTISALSGLGVALTSVSSEDYGSMCDSICMTVTGLGIYSFFKLPSSRDLNQISLETKIDNNIK